MGDLPTETVEAAERLTRLARNVVDEREVDAYRARRADLLARYGYTSRLREDATGETLVCYPAEWVEDGTVRIECIENTARAVEVPLDGPGDPDDWSDVDAHNRAVVDAVRQAHGDVHGENASAFADFMSNHYARPLESASAAEFREFLTEYYPRNAWPSDDQREYVAQSLEYTFEVAGKEPPTVQF